MRRKLGSLQSDREGEPTRSITAKLDGSLKAYGGNTDGVVWGASLQLAGRTGRHLGFFAATGDYSHLDGETQVRRSFAHARYNYELSEGLWWELFGQLESNKFIAVRLRELVGTGPRLQLFDADELQAFFGTAYMLEHTELASDVTPPDRPALVHRSSNYLTFSWLVDERVSLVSTTYYQPRFDEPSDYRLFSQLSADFGVTTVLKAGMSLMLRYDSLPPGGVESTDWSVVNTLGLEL
ncbi:MAG: DUF481 domain-containing protein [Myxococcales bacterium]|nr:DUF481 domain-containing protein [Myxococcales bacterium]